MRPLVYHPPAPNTFAGGSSVHQPRLDLDSLDINDPTFWTGTHPYTGLLRSNTEMTPMAPPPIRVPSRTPSRRLSFQPPRSSRHGDGGDGGGMVPVAAAAAPGRTTGTRSARTRGPAPIVEADNFYDAQGSENSHVSGSGQRVHDIMDDGFGDLLVVVMEDDDDSWMYGMYDYALHVDKHLSRAPYREPAMSGLEWVKRKLANNRACYTMFRMSPTDFNRLHDLLVESYGLTSSSKSSSVEALGMFLWIVGAPQSVRQAEDRFERSLGTVHNMFHKVLKCMMKLVPDVIKPVDPQFAQMHERLRSHRFYPEFKDCIETIDGTHVPCVVPNGLFVQHLCRKGMTTQNVMAACDFDMRFTFALVGWPGSVHDMRVFDDATTRWNHVFSHTPEGKYYLVDSGYANRIGYPAPYKGSRYHPQEYEDAQDCSCPYFLKKNG